jgi:hypothetical protein
MVKCPTCGEDYDFLGGHFRWTDHRPEYSSWQLDVVIGLVLGDGYIRNPSGKRESKMILEMSNKTFLQWLDSRMGWVTTGVKIHRTAEENAEHAKKSGLRHTSGSPENFEDTYRLRFRSNPTLSWLREKFYPSGEKEIPSNLRLNSRRATYWYVSDGGLQRNNYGNKTLQISSRSFPLERISRMFREAGFDPSANGDHSVQFGHSESCRVLEWMEGPVRGFEYKWD